MPGFVLSNTGDQLVFSTTSPPKVRETSPDVPAVSGSVSDQTYNRYVAISTLDVSGEFSGTVDSYELSVNSDALPEGLSLNEGTGEITGTPTESTLPTEPLAIKVRARNARGLSGELEFNITVQQISITNVTANGATLEFETDESGDSEVYWTSDDALTDEADVITGTAEEAGNFSISGPSTSGSIDLSAYNGQTKVITFVQVRDSDGKRSALVALTVTIGTDLNTSFQFSTGVQEDAISNVVAQQVVGVGSGASGYQIRTTFDYPVETLLTGAFISRPAISNYSVGGDTKSGILTEFGAGGWPDYSYVADLTGAGGVAVESATTLASGTTYNSLHFYIGPTYAQDFTDALDAEDATAAQTALDNADGVGELFPSGDAVSASNAVTIVATTTPATLINFTGSVQTSAPAGTLVGSLTADRSNGTWSLLSAPSWLEIGSQTSQQALLTVKTGQTAPFSPTTAAFTPQYDNSAVSGGGTYSSAKSVTVFESTGDTERYLPVPTVNANSNGQNLTLAQFNSLAASADGGGSNWQSAMSSLGIATTGVDATVSLAATDFNANFLVQNVGPFTDGSNTRRINVVGQGTFTRDAWSAIGGTKVNKLQVRNSEGLRFWLIETETSSPGSDHHQINNCEDVFFNRCAIHGDVARSAGAAANRPNIQGPLLSFYGSTNVGIRQCSVVGTGVNVFNQYINNGNTNGVLIEGCVFDQMVSDMVSFGTNNVNNNWTVRDNYWGGRVRRQLGVHPDICQFSNGSAGTGWLFEGNFCGTTGWFGPKYNPSNKLIQSNDGSADQNATFIDNYNVTPTFMIDGVGYRHRNGSATNNTIVNTPDLLLADESQEQGDILCRNGIKAGVGTVDYNFYMRDNNSLGNLSVGPNDELVFDTGFVPADRAGYDFSEMANWWEDYFVPANPVANVNQIRPSHRASTIWGHRPKTGSRLHWNHADPVGAYRWAERTFDATNHDNPYDWGWPTACQFRIAFDSGQQFPNATAANSFDANGD